MAAKLLELGRDANRGEPLAWRANAAVNLLKATALARFLSYLGFGHGEGM